MSTPGSALAGPSTARIGSGGRYLPAAVDLLVVGLGVTGAGVALDAASRGLTVLAVDAHDVAFGTSRWSSKLVHGGLRYLAHLQVGVAHESAVERDRLMTTIAPHLTRTLPMLTPLTPEVSGLDAAVVRTGLGLGDLLRVGARTPAAVLPRSRRVRASEALALAPALRRDVRGGLLGHDGQLEDDARLVLAVARTAAAHGAVVRTRLSADRLTGHGATLRDTRTGRTHEVRARAVVNAAGVWAGALVPGVRLRPSRGSHLVLRASAVPGLRSALTVPLPGSRSRFVLVLPQPDGTAYVGLTDEPVTGPVPDVPEPTEAEERFLRGTLDRVLARPLTDDDVVGRYAGLRPLLDAEGSTADLSRRHAVLTSPDGVVTVVGGKLTTYRRMAQDAVDTAVARAGLDAGPCRTRDLPLLGAADRATLARVDAPPRLVRRYGTLAPQVLADARASTGWDTAVLLSPVAEGVPTRVAALVPGVTHEGATSVADLLERRTRVGLVPADAARARPAAERVLGRSSSPTS